MDFIFHCQRALRTIYERNPKVLAAFFVLVVFSCLATNVSLFADTSSQTLSAPAVSQPVDPNKGPSELNHHIAGWALVAIGLLQLATLVFPDRKSHRYVWPALFVLAGLFLALWSDGEIWPRGNLNWAFLLQHDAEARQHKIYSILLIAIGILEYIRIRGSLPRFWKTWGFPLLAIVGASLLLIHDHTASSGARTPEAQAYLVNPALDVDGSVRKPAALAGAVATSEGQHQGMHDVSETPNPPDTMQPDSMAMDHSELAMDHSQMTMDPAPSSAPPASHHHVMTASMLLVEREHMWFVVVGLAIALFKFLSDGDFFRNRILPYLSPACMLLLGIMLTFYRE